MKKKVVLAGAVAALVAFQMLPGKASSHREAPLISQETKLIDTVDANLTLDGLQLVASRLARR